MAAGILVPLEEYLSREYEPDVDYDEGILIERNVGKEKHSVSQAAIAEHLWNHRKQWDIRVYVEQRIQVAPRRFCVVDICALPANSCHEDIVRTPPRFTIEILSPDDKFAEIERRAQKYLAMGVKYVWTVDPETGRCWRHDPQNWMVIISDSTLRVDGNPIEIPVAELIRDI